MITISICMIVKNEEHILARCLDSLAGLAEEILIIDTGSTDRTKEIARQYTDKIYDFQWVDDFSAARNYAFEKATMEYVYSADADEVLDETNRQRFKILKENLLSEVEIVQMKYGNQLQYGTIYNFDEEYRPKLFKRIRKFSWMDPIHETISITPVIYDSDIVITHLPEENHSSRDLENFRRQIQKGIRLSTRLHNLYAKELFVSGTEKDFREAKSFFEESVQDCSRTPDEIKEACCVVAKAMLLEINYECFFKYAMKVIASDECSEICELLGEYYYQKEDYDEAVIWFYNAAFETQPILNIKAGTTLPKKGLADSYHKLGNDEEAKKYEKEVL